MPSPTVPKLRVPLRLEAGRLGVVEQGSPENVSACVYAIIATERGSRIEDPDFGVADPTFDTLPLDTEEWVEQVAAYEPRAQISTAQDIEAALAIVNVAEAPSA